MLVELTLGGQDPAFEVLMERYMPIVMGYLCGKTRNRCDTEDLAQEIFIKVHRNLDRLRTPERFGPWLMCIVRSRLIDYYRVLGKQATVIGSGTDLDGRPCGALETAATREPDPAASAHMAEVHDLVLNEMEQLPAKYRTILYGRLIGQEKTLRIARRMGLKETTVRTRFFRGIRMLRNALKKHGIEPRKGI